jgi:type II secretory pathway component PulL
LAGLRGHLNFYHIKHVLKTNELFTDNDQILSEKLNVKYAQKINLLNVDWSSNWKEKLYKWRASIIILLLLMVLSPVQLILDNHNLTQRVNGQSNINEIYFKKLFPEVSRIVDLHAQIKQKLSTLSIKEQSDDLNNFFGFCVRKFKVKHLVV